MDDKIYVKINGNTIETSKGTSILSACKSANIYVPTLCNHPDIPPSGKCGICVVKINGINFALSCCTKVTSGMIIETNSPEVKKRAQQAFSNFTDMTFLPISREIEDIMAYFSNKGQRVARKAEKTNSISFNPKLCVNCGRCVRMCADIQSIGALSDDSHSLLENDCIQCGQCITVCPTKAIRELNSTSQIIRALSSGKTLALQVAPSLRVSFGEYFGLPIGTVVTGKIIAAARGIGFRYVFDTIFGTSISVIEEGTELLQRMKNGGPFPLFTSCCPSWVNYVEKLHPEIIPYLSSTRSPHIITGSIIKNYFSNRNNIDPSNLFIVSLMPCTSKKDEICREQLKGDVDAVITSREFYDLIMQFDIDWDLLPNDSFDTIVEEQYDPGTLFGVSGGVAEAIMRFIHQVSTKESNINEKYRTLRSTEGFRSHSFKILDNIINVAVCNGIAYAKDFIESSNFKQYHFVEVMACPFGCIGGGGQPILSSRSQAHLRAKSIYEIDDKFNKYFDIELQKSVQVIYNDFLGDPCGRTSKILLHTTYHQQNSPYLEMKRLTSTLPIIAYGSATNNASRFARILAGYIGTMPIQMNMISMQTLSKHTMIVFICSTSGSGEFPVNSLKFVSLLKESKEKFPNLSFILCAIGSKEYPSYCAAGKALLSMLMDHEAKCMHSIEIDTSSFDKGEGAFEQWTEDCLKILGIRANIVTMKPSYNLNFIKNDEDSIINNPDRPIGFEYSVLLSSSVLTPQGYEPEMHRYQIKLPLGSSYQTGDHIGILPQNEPEICQAVIDEFHLDPQIVVNIETLLPEGYNLIPPRVTIKQLFSQYLDLNGIPNRNLIRAYKQYTTDPLIVQKYDSLLDNVDRTKFNAFIENNSIGEFILEFSKYGFPPLDLFITVCPHIRPRFYCVASAPTGNMRTLDLIVSDAFFGPGNSRRGMCTSYLKRFGLTKIALCIENGRFGYPLDPTSPIIMVALGCGIAPMLSLLQHREMNPNDLGRSALFFGCRYRNLYPVIDTLLEGYAEQGCLQDLFFSYSRENDLKSRIIDVFSQQDDILWSYWSNPKSHLFYCGPSRNTPDKLKEILIRISVERGSMTKAQAESFFALHQMRIIWF